MLEIRSIVIETVSNLNKSSAYQWKTVLKFVHSVKLHVCDKYFAVFVTVGTLDYKI